MKRIIFADKKLGWGKHKDETGRMVFGNDPSYLLWAVASEYAEVDEGDEEFARKVSMWVSEHPKEFARVVDAVTKRKGTELASTPQTQRHAPVNPSTRADTGFVPATASDAAWGSW